MLPIYVNSSYFLKPFFFAYLRRYVYLVETEFKYSHSKYAFELE